jgi:poly-gamma-glutamate capsule biosynthesis protein CapA/YwtB (metallophosphatase superfamily)
MSEAIVLLGCGDVGPIHEPMAQYSGLVRDTLAEADIRFAQVERVYSERGELQPHGGAHGRLPPHMASVLTDCGFNVVSVAGNHAMDWGPEPLLDTIELLRGMGIRTIGAGRNLAEARQPALIDAKGLRVAMLAYCSVLHEGYAAGLDTPGVAPMRATARFEPVDYQPGVPPRVITTPDAQDLVDLVDDVRAAREQADAVVLSLHWGVHFVPRIIADYQRTVAQAAFSAGADLILGHHAHVPKAIEVFGGKTCFYSLSNFIMSSSPKVTGGAEEFRRNYGVPLDPAYPNMPYGMDGKRSLVAKAVISKDGIRTSFLPTLIDTQLRPEILHAGDPRFTTWWATWSGLRRVSPTASRSRVTRSPFQIESERVDQGNPNALDIFKIVQRRLVEILFGAMPRHCYLTGRLRTSERLRVRGRDVSPHHELFTGSAYNCPAVSRCPAGRLRRRDRNLGEASLRYFCCR